MTEEDVFAGAFAPDQEPVADPAPEPEPASEPAPEPAPQEPSPEPEPQPEAPPAPEVKAEQVPPGHVPLAALLDVRDKLKDAEARLRAAPQPQAQPQDVPDPYEDPAGYQQWTSQQAESARWDAVTSVSQVMANEKHGEDKVKEATDAFMAEAQTKPWLIAELRQQAHPYEYVVRRQQQQALLGQLKPDDFAQFQAWKAAQAAQPATPAAPVAVIPPQPAPKPPPSIASAPSAGGMGVIADEDPYAAEFSKKG